MEKLKLRYFQYNIELNHPFTVSGFSRTFTPTIQVEILYNGFKGYGEASMPPYLGETPETVCKFLAKVNIEQFLDPFMKEDILSYIDNLEPGNNAAKAAIDIALHDLIGKMLNIPLYRLLGKNKHDIPAISYTIGIDTPEIMKSKTLEVDGRFKILKVKVGLDNDIKNVEAIRSVSELSLTADANQGWTNKEKALETIFKLQELGVIMIEQPMPKEMKKEIEWLKQRSPLPLIADESVKRLKDMIGLENIYDGVNIKLMKSTGINEALKMIDYAHLNSMKVMIGCMTETSCAISAAAAIASGADYADLDGNLLIKNDLYKGPEIKNGRLCLNDLPGLGILPKH